MRARGEEFKSTLAREKGGKGVAAPPAEVGTKMGLPRRSWSYRARAAQVEFTQETEMRVQCPPLPPSTLGTEKRIQASVSSHALSRGPAEGWGGGRGWGDTGREHTSSLVSLLIRTLILCDPGTTLLPPLISVTSSEAPSPNTATLGTKASTYVF